MLLLLLLLLLLMMMLPVLTLHPFVPPPVTQEMKKNLLDMIGDDIDGSKAVSLGARGGSGQTGGPGNKAVGENVGQPHLGQLQQRDHVGARGAVGNMPEMAGNGGGLSAAISHLNPGTNSNIGLGSGASSSSSNAPAFTPSMSMMNAQNAAQVIAHVLLCPPPDDVM